MNHPFTSKPELIKQQLNLVNGGSQLNTNPEIKIEKLKPVIKPAIGSTMAIGEEGGFFNNF